MNTENHRIAVLGLGYVGLPVALALAEKLPDVVGFDINSDRRTHKKQSNPVPSPYNPRVRVGSNNS